MKRIEEFVRYGKKYVYFDMSYFKTNDEFRLLVEMAKPVIEKYKKQTMYAITNVEGIRFDTETKEILTEWIRHNAPYIKHSVVIGMDGVKKIMLNAMIAAADRYNFGIATTKEQAVEMLKLKDWAKLDRWARA